MQLGQVNTKSTSSSASNDHLQSHLYLLLSRLPNRDARLNAVLLKCIFDCISLGLFRLLLFVFSLVFGFTFACCGHFKNLCTLRCHFEVVNFFRICFFARASLDSFFCFISSWLFGIFNKRRQKGSLFFFSCAPPLASFTLVLVLVFC